MASIEPSQDRLSRITAALCLERNTPTASEEDTYASQTKDEERDTDLDLSREIVNVSNEISIDENENGPSIGFKADTRTSYTESETKEQSRASEEETEIRRTAQALFELEETILDQHIANIKVSYETLCNFVFLLFSPTYHLSL